MSEHHYLAMPRSGADHSPWQGKVGTVFLRPHPSDDKLLVRYAGQKEELVCPLLLNPTSSFFGGKIVTESLSLDPFEVGCEVQVRDRESVMAGFDAAGRDDYFDFMDEFCTEGGVVDFLHPTNGIRVRLDSDISLWYEPPCLRIISAAAPKARATSVRRWLAGQRVRLNYEPSPYHGQFGLIQLHFHKFDYTKVTVRFPDGREEYVDDTCVMAATRQAHTSLLAAEFPTEKPLDISQSCSSQAFMPLMESIVA